MWQTPVLLPESVRLALVQLFYQKHGRLPNNYDLSEIEEVVKYIYQSK